MILIQTWLGRLTRPEESRNQYLVEIVNGVVVFDNVESYRSTDMESVLLIIYASGRMDYCIETIESFTGKIVDAEGVKEQC